MKTPVIRYFLDNSKKIKNLEKRVAKELILAEVNYAYIYYNKKGNREYKPFKISLEASILPRKFGLISENYKFNSDVFKNYSKNNASIKTKMGYVETAVNALHNNYEVAKELPTPEKFKSDLLVELGRKEKNVEPDKTILDYLYKKIDNSEQDSGKSKKDSLKENTIKVYRTVSHLIENYQLAKNEILTFNNFDKTKYWEFWDVLDEILKGNISVENPNQPKKQRKQKHGYLVSTLRKYQVSLIRTLKDAKNDVEMVIDVYDKNLILEKQDASKDIYITEEELQIIIDSDVSNNVEMQMAKDYMIIGSLTGMRYESMFDTREAKVEVCKEGEYNFEYIHSKQNKTSTEVIIPLLGHVKNVLQKSNNNFPIVKSNAEINSYLKKLFEHLGIDREENEILNTYRNGVITTKKSLYQLITTHDCKKTFYTNLYNNHVNPTVIDNITHPDKATENRMAKIYNKTTMIAKAKMFVDEINKINSDIYRF